MVELQHQERQKLIVAAAERFCAQFSTHWARSLASKLNAARVRFEKRALTGAKAKLHRLSHEAGILCLTCGDPCPYCFDNTQRIQSEVYSLSSPWGRAHNPSEMRDTIANLQSFYQCQGRVFSDGPSELSDNSRRTGGRDRQRRSSAKCEAPSCREMADSRASEQDN